MVDGGILGILGSTILKDVLLPFILVFVLMFALLEKTGILGQGKHQINSIIAFVMGLLLIGVPAARNAMTGIIPTISVLAVVLLLFMIIYGFVGGTQQGVLGKGLQIIIAIIAVVTIIASLLWSFGLIPFVQGLSSQPWFSTAWQSVLFIVVIVVLVYVALKSAGNAPKSSG